MAKKSKNKSNFVYRMGGSDDIQSFLPRLNYNDPISKKMNQLCQMSVLPKYDLENRKGIIDFLRSLFLPFYPECLLLAFGSTMNGFGTKGCDMDVMFSPSPEYELLDASEIIDNEDLPTIHEARRNPSALARLPKMSSEKQLRFLLRVLRQNKSQVKQAVYIPAKCPILRFNVVRNGYHCCDLSFQHGLARCNTELLRFFSLLDIRVQPLMITLRFWAKHFQIIHMGAFSSYAFTLMVIFFLQNLEEPILPPVNDLMVNAESHIIDGWEAGFICNLNRQDFISRNTLSEEELLHEFFKFYWNFDFARNVVCIRTGKARPVSDIRKDTDERMKEFKITDICVQDPFNLSHNVAASVGLSRLQFLKPYFFVANSLLSKQSQSHIFKDIFKLLFDRKLYENMIHERFFHNSHVPGCFYIFPSFESVTGIRDNFERLWFKQASQAVRDILEYIFFFDCEVIDKNCSVEDTDCSEQRHGKLLLSIQCAVDNRMWKHRSTKAKKDVPLDSYRENFTNETLREQNALSHFLFASDPGLCPEPFIWFLCNIHQSEYSQVPFICIELVLLSETESLETSEFKSLSNLLKNFIPPTVKKMLIN